MRVLNENLRIRFLEILLNQTIRGMSTLYVFCTLASTKKKKKKEREKKIEYTAHCKTHRTELENPRLLCRFFQRNKENAFRISGENTGRFMARHSADKKIEKYCKENALIKEER